MRISPQECKILIYSKMKHKGLTYSEAKAEVENDQKHLESLTKEVRKARKESKKPNFREEFNKLRNGKRKKTEEKE